MLLLQCLHLLLLLVTSMNGFSNRSANGTSHILTSVIVTQNISGTNAMRNKALLVFALCNVLPQALHAGTVRSDRASTILVLTLGCVAQQK